MQQVGQDLQNAIATSSIFDPPGAANASGRNLQAAGQTGKAVGGSLKAALNQFVNTDYFLNKWGMFEPIRQAQTAAYAYWVATHWKDMGVKMVEAGVPKAQALQIVKQEAANYMNLVSGMVPHYKDAAKVRRTLYGNPAIGALSPFFSALTPGWLRAKVHGLMSVVDPLIDRFLSKHKPIGETAMIENQAYREFIRKQWQRQFVMQVAGGFAGIQMLNAMLNWGQTSVQQNPHNPKKWFGFRAGDRDYSWPFFGMFKDVVRILGKDAAVGDLPDMARWFTDQLNTPARTLIGLASNDLGNGDPIVSPDRSLGALPDKAWDVSKYTLMKSFNTEDLMGVSNHPYPFAGARGTSSWGIPDWAASLLGFHATPYNMPLSEKAYMESLEEIPRSRVSDYIRPNIERYVRDGDKEALEEAMQYALRPTPGNGYRLSGDTRDRFKYSFHDGLYRMSIDQFEEQIKKIMEPMGYSLSRLDEEAQAWLYNRIKAYRDAQTNDLVEWSVRRHQIVEKEGPPKP